MVGLAYVPSDKAEEILRSAPNSGVSPHLMAR